MSQKDLFSSLGSEGLSLPGAELRLFQAWIENKEASELYASLSEGLVWTQPTIKIAGQTHKIPRLQSWVGEPEALYAYSGQTFEPAAWTDELLQLQARLKKEFGVLYNSVLVNWYRDGNDGVSWHADNEQELGPNPSIASVSLGETRKFSFKPSPSNPHQAEAFNRALYLNNGDLLIMSGATQKNWLHAIPKTRQVVGGRINLTFRRVLARNPSD